MPKLDRNPDGVAYYERDQRADGGTRTVRLNPRGVRIERALAGVKMRLAIPIQAYRGVVLSREEQSTPILSPQPGPQRRRSFGDVGARQRHCHARRSMEHLGAVFRDAGAARRDDRDTACTAHDPPPEPAANFPARKAAPRAHAQSRRGPCRRSENQPGRRRIVPARIDLDLPIAAVHVEQRLAPRATSTASTCPIRIRCVESSLLSISRQSNTASAEASTGAPVVSVRHVAAAKRSSRLCSVRPAKMSDSS